MVDYVMTRDEELMASQRRIIDVLREELSVKDLLIQSLRDKIKRIEGD